MRAKLRVRCPVCVDENRLGHVLTFTGVEGNPDYVTILCTIGHKYRIYATLETVVDMTEPAQTMLTLDEMIEAFNVHSPPKPKTAMDLWLDANT